LQHKPGPARQPCYRSGGDFGNNHETSDLAVILFPPAGARAMTRPPRST